MISRDKESSFSFPSNKLESFLFTSQSSASRCVCTHRAERAIFRDTNTPELAHAHTHTHTHIKKRYEYLSLSVSLSLSLFLSIRCFSSSRVQRHRDDDMIRCLSRGPISRSGNSNHHHPAGETKKKKKIQSAQYYLFTCRFVSVSLSLCVSPSPSVDSPNTDLFSFHSASQKLLRGTAAKAQRISHHAGKNFTLAINDNNKYNGERV